MRRRTHLWHTLHHVHPLKVYGRIGGFALGFCVCVVGSVGLGGIN